jgi:ribosome-binding factor A
MKHRLLRVNELLKRELSIAITRELTFDGALVTVNQVDATPDLKSAHVFVSVLGSEKPFAVTEKLEENRVMLQNEISRKVVLKYTPHLIFHLDNSTERGSRIIEILQEIETPDTSPE